jgi:hypothetical protein
MYDTKVASDDVKVSPWVIIDGKAAGIIAANQCSSGVGNAARQVNFFKLKGFRNELLAAAPFEIK